MYSRIMAVILAATLAGCGGGTDSRSDLPGSDLTRSDQRTADGKSVASDILTAEDGARVGRNDVDSSGACGECEPGLECIPAGEGKWKCLDAAEECAQFCAWEYAECGELKLWWDDGAPVCDCGTCPGGYACNSANRCCLLSCSGHECGQVCDGTHCGKCDQCEDCVEGNCLLPETGSLCQAFACGWDDSVCENEDAGWFGCKCETDEDCVHICISILDGKVCSREGGEECPGGWSMKGVDRGPDLLYMCVPEVAALCWPCNDDADCATGLGWGTCIDRGALGSFCATGCSCTSECHIGFACYPSEDSAWGAGYCLPDSPDKDCHCNPTAQEEALSTTCYVENEYGKCFGQRQCTTDGLTHCDALEPLPETCNNLDDDCNGLVDEVEGCDP